jgi:hypothetical protein
MQDEPLLHRDEVRLISVVLPFEFVLDVGVCVALFGWGFVAFIFCRILRELEKIVVVARWLCVVTGGDSTQYMLRAVRGCRMSPLLLVISCCSCCD